MREVILSLIIFKSGHILIGEISARKTYRKYICIDFEKKRVFLKHSNYKHADDSPYHIGNCKNTKKSCCVAYFDSHSGKPTCVNHKSQKFILRKPNFRNRGKFL